MKYHGVKLVVSASLFCSLSLSAALAEGEGVGAKLFQKCRSCHLIHAPSVEMDAQRSGPNLFGIENRVVGALEGFAYSKALLEAGAAGEIWDRARLDAFLASPRNVYPKTKMVYAGMENADDRQALIDFLFVWTPDLAAASKDPEVAPEILAIEGDAEYGEYLASTCLTCHQIGGSDRGIPSIIGWPVVQFVTTMHAYKNKDRDNAVMQQYAGALSDEEIAALAVYFESLGVE